MTPPANALAPRAPARSSPRVERPEHAGPRRPPLRLAEPARRRSVVKPVRRPALVWLSGVVVVGSLLAVVAGDALLAEGQVRLSDLQTRVAGAVAEQKSLQVAVSEKAAPPVVVGQAEGQGLVAPTQVVYLPQVPLDVPLPAPQVTPVPARSTGSAPAGAPSGAAPPATASAASRSSSTASGSATVPSGR